MKLAEIKAGFLFSLRYPQLRATITGFVLAALICLVIGGAYWYPQKQSFDSLQIEIDELRRDIVSKERNLKIAHASSLAEHQLVLIDAKLDSLVTQGELVRNLALLAHQSNVRILSEAYQERKAIDGYIPLEHELTLQAGYAELRRFIAGVQQLPSLTLVQEVQMSRMSNSSTIKAQLSFVSYRRESGRKS